MTSEFKSILAAQYGKHEFDYPHLSDTNVKSVIRAHRCKTFADLDRWCRKLDQTVAEIEAMKARMKP